MTLCRSLGSAFRLHSLSTSESASSKLFFLVAEELRLEPRGDIILSIKNVLIRLIGLDRGKDRLFNVECEGSCTGVVTLDVELNLS